MSFTKREKIIIDNLFDITKDIEGVRSSRHAAAVVKRGIVYGMGVNSNKTDAFQQQFTNNPEKVFSHAEIAALKRTKNQLRTDDLSDFTLIIIRGKKDDGTNEWQFGDSKPCDMCQKAIESFGIRKIIYSIEDGIKVEKIYRGYNGNTS